MSETWVLYTGLEQLPILVTGLPGFVVCRFGFSTTGFMVPVLGICTIGLTALFARVLMCQRLSQTDQLSHIVGAIYHILL